MALPQLNTSPKYELKIPSTNEQAFFRPFLVKEQKVMMMAYESQERKQIVKAMLDTVSACLETTTDVYSLTTFDIDYIFTKIRSKSVGEKVDIKIKCKECESYTEVNVNLDELEAPVVEGTKVVELNDDISLTLKYPTYSDFIRNPKILESGNTEMVIEVIISCMDSIQTKDENIVLKDETREEIIRFIDSMSSQQFEMVTEFVQNMPTMSKDVSFDCQNCGAHNKTVLQGLDDFLS